MKAAAIKVLKDNLSRYLELVRQGEVVLVTDREVMISTQDLGFETRQVLAGVAEHMTPEALIGKTVVVVANLAP